MQTHDQFKGKDIGNKLKRYFINLKEKTVSQEDVIVMATGGLDFPQYNPLYEGKKQRFHYLTEVFANPVFNATYKWPLVKYDEEVKKIVKEWAPDGIMA